MQEYLTDLYHTVLLKDVAARLRVADVTSLEQVTKFLLHNIGSRVSATKIANTLKSAGKGVDQKRISDNYPKLLLTLDEVFATADYDGIQKRNVLDWLLEDPG